VRPGERRLRRHTINLLASLMAAGLFAMSGCGSSGPAIDRTDMVNDLAARLNQAVSVDYTARYQLSGGVNATVSQTKEPRQVAYRWPDGALILTSQATTRCTGTPLACTMTAAPASAPPQASATELIKHGLLPAQKVSALLTAAALDLGTDIRQRDSTIAGQPASCVEVSGDRDERHYEFDVCVITDGVLGSFNGKVDGTPIELALTQYSQTVPADAFATATPKPSPSPL
jgi:hypothetical protein